MLAPKPSTVPMRVSVAMSGSGTPLVMRWRAWATFGKLLGPGVERHVERSRCRTARVFCACQASMAGTRNFVRGDT